MTTVRRKEWIRPMELGYSLTLVSHGRPTEGARIGGVQLSAVPGQASATVGSPEQLPSDFRAYVEMLARRSGGTTYGFRTLEARKESWSELAALRIRLIDKELDGSLTDLERLLLTELDALVDSISERLYPVPQAKLAEASAWLDARLRTR